MPDPDHSGSATRVMLIRPPGRWSSFGFADLWHHRELVYFLTWRDIKVRYKQAILGVAWAVIQPLVLMAIFTFFIGHIGDVPSLGLPYPVFVLSGLVPWTFFANAVTGAGDSLVTNANLVSKVFFPRLVMPVSAMFAWLPDLGISFILLLLFLVGFGVIPAWTAVAAPAFVLLALVAAFSVGVWLSALNVAYRDVRYAVPFLVQAWLFLTPVVYPASALSDRLQPLLGLNPVAGVVEGFRWALFGTPFPSPGLMLTSLTATGILLVGGLVYFRRVEHYFADVI